MPDAFLAAAAARPGDAEALEVVRAWEATLDAMELHLDEIKAGLEVGALPNPYEVPAPGGAMPASLTHRALRLAALQRDVEDLLRQRLAVLSSVLSGGFERDEAPPAPVFVDQRS